MLYSTAAQLDFAPSDLPALPRPGRVLLCTPDYFDVEYVINPHMQGNVGDVDRSEAVRTWRILREAYLTLGFQPNAVSGVEGLPDMVFCANQTLPFYRPKDGQRGVVLSRMHAPERRDEVDHFERFFHALAYEVAALPDTVPGSFEGMGDALWHPGRHLLWGGYGYRTDRRVYEHLTDLLDVHVLTLELTDPDFYHLDTCLSPLDESTALYYPAAFHPEGAALIRAVFPNVIEAPEDEARRLLACNAHCPDGRHVLIQSGCTETIRRLRAGGFEAIEMQTGEFLKAGGSVFCMKQMYW